MRFSAKSTRQHDGQQRDRREVVGMRRIDEISEREREAFEVRPGGAVRLTAACVGAASG
jgi:hypothetical protein